MLPSISGLSSIESRSMDALDEVELNVPAEVWKIGAPIGYPYDLMAAR
jgi:hypothetical protein